jgi:CRISPR-associated protein Cas1
MHRILDFSETPARLRIDRGCLSIERTDQPTIRIPTGEICAVILAHPQINCTQSVLADIAAAGGVLITCDAKRLPVGILLPLQAHFTQTERFLAQSKAKEPLKKQLWREIVQAKVRIQGLVLKSICGVDAGLPALARHVLSGDTSNIEAQAARRYWQNLFPGIDFHRDRDAPNQNQLLNYGYAVLRAIVARATCAVGLHLSIGLHHRNRYNPCCLADDLMEPFRPAVDVIVARLAAQQGPDTPLSMDSRQQLLDGLYQRWKVGGDCRTLFDAAEQLASSVVENLMGKRCRLRLPTELEMDHAVSAS